MLKFNIPPTPDTTEFTEGTLNRLSSTGIHKASGEIKVGIYDRQRDLSGEEVIAFIGEACGRVIRGNRGLVTDGPLINPITEYVEALTSEWENPYAIDTFRDNFIHGAVDEGIYAPKAVEELGVTQ